MAVNKTNAMTFATNVLTRRLNGSCKVEGSHTGLQDVLSRSMSTQGKTVDLDVSLLLYSNNGGKLYKGGCDITTSDILQYVRAFWQETSDSPGMDPVGHCTMSRLFNVEIERARLTGRRVVIVRTSHP